ncbi:FAD-binding protein [Sedimentibacter sp.]|uniref:FAD-binding protein n=1 Tax=Sedimentibacter sp. TaxID=1960295 RepID=UPI0028A87F7C|nr:FAD-binding protein [Sedimentibacter sp.]
MNTKNNWPYPSLVDETETMEADVLILGGGIAGCMAAISAAKKGKNVIVVEKAAAKRSGAGGSGCDHWEMAATNPCSSVTPEELVEAMMDDNDGYNNAISHYIECREGWDRLLDIEKIGGKIRDTDDEFAGAMFRDEETKLMFAYDYKSKITLRIWATTFKPAMEKEMLRLGVRIVNHVAVTSLLTEGGKNGARCIGATGINGRTGKFHIFLGKAVVMAMSRPARIWLFSAAYPGLCEFRPMSCIGSGHAMGWKIGAEFNMMEKSVRAQFSAAGRSFPPYSTGNNHNTWYAASLIDAEGKEIPYADRDGNILKEVNERFYPAKGQKYFMKGGNIEKAKYPYEGPETLPYEQIKDKGYKLPLYADLTELPEHERNVIWGMMVGEEGKTKIPVYKNFTEAGFDSSRHVLQCYGSGWTSAEFLPQERQLFGLPGGFMNDWKLQTNIPGLFAAGDALFASNCYGHAASTGHYAGRHASDYADEKDIVQPYMPQVEDERERVYAPLHTDVDTGITWKELNHAISKAMQSYCGEIKEEMLLRTGMELLKKYEREVVPKAAAANPHELVRLLEVFDILTVSQIIIESSLLRKNNCPKLEFFRSDSNSKEQEPFIIIRNDGEKVVSRKAPLDYAGDLKSNYETYNSEYVKELRQ